MSLVEKVSNVLGDRKEEVVTTPLLVKFLTLIGYSSVLPDIDEASQFKKE